MQIKDGGKMGKKKKKKKTKTKKERTKAAVNEKEF